MSGIRHMSSPYRSTHIRIMNLKTVAYSFPPVTLAVLISLRFVDTWMARAAMRLLRSSRLLLTGTSNIPDFLLALVCIGSGLLWGIYFILSYEGVINKQTRFSQFAGCALPLAYVMKGFFKYVFGRTNTRIWLAGQARDNFHWFQGGGIYSGFPSGHMAVFTALFTTTWLFYPRSRSLSIGAMLVLAVALVATDYHFLSDVIAGAYVGLLAVCLTRTCFDTFGTELD